MLLTLTRPTPERWTWAISLPKHPALTTRQLANSTGRNHAELLHVGEDVNDFDRKVKVGENPVETCEQFPRMPSGCRERTIVSDCCV